MTTIAKDLLVTATGGLNIDNNLPKLPGDELPKLPIRPIRPIGPTPSPTFPIDSPIAGSGRFNAA